MLFNSLNFVVFFLVVYALYLVLPHRGQNRMLLVAGYVFYGWWDWRFLGLLLFSTVVDYFVALAISRTEDPRRRRMFLVLSMTNSLGMLGFFKYFNFFSDSALRVLSSLGFATSSHHLLNIILPVGISFYTFQTMSYTIDVYRRQIEPTRRFLDFALFVAFFPQLVAGPIERASHLLPQVLKPRRVDWLAVQEGSWLLLWGLFKKAVIADNLAGVSERVFSGSMPLTAGSVLLGVYAFAFQIYGDFSGYSDIARGLSRLMGFQLMVNFNNPYLALNPADFWKRWHISLSTWLRDYLYIPLGGNRRGRTRTYINLVMTMLLGGLWHGAAWTYVAWGAFHGTLLVVHRLVFGDRPAPEGRAWSIWARRIGFFHLICISWLLFRAPSIGQAGDMLLALVRAPYIPLNLLSDFLFLIILCLPLWLVQLLEENTRTLDAARTLSFIPKTALFAVLIVMLIALGNTGGHAFIYFQF